MTLAWMGTLPEELDPLRAALEAPRRQHHAGREFHTGRLDGREVVLVLAGRGAVATATTATLLIERYGAEALVATGLVTSLTPGVRIGDLLVARELCQPALDGSPLFARPARAGAGRARLPTDALLADALAAAAHAALAAERIGLAASFEAFDIGDPLVHEGLLLSGEGLPATAAECRALHGEWPEALAVECTGAALAQVCDDCDLPFALLHTVAARADGSAPADLPRFAAALAAPLSAAVLRCWLRAAATPEPPPT